ncbi:hypothetical protein [Microvirga massiliensis]|uniref:hypothetical protein n=1 Tax=Microvirga massiliensis TaxID=1033741 RepID=UPI000661116F|nr:hypothetical protein [Microvirga massiliensis]
MKTNTQLLDLKTLPDHAFVAEFLASNGAMGEALTEEQIWELYCMADGFGWLPEPLLARIADGWDYEHIEKSSPQALRLIRRRIEEITRAH